MITAGALEKLRASSGTVSFTDGTDSSLVDSMKRAGIDRSVVLPVATNPAKVSHINEIAASLYGKD